MHLRTDTGQNAHFAAVPTISHSRNGFSVSETHKTTTQFDYLYPIYRKFIYPGDTLNISEAVMARLNTQKYTLYDDLYIDLHAWFVPMRLIQTDWARYQFNAQPTGPSQDNSALRAPQINVTGMTTGFASKTLYDYFGYPTKVNLTGGLLPMNNYLGRAYNLIWNENYRDENLQNAVTVDLGNGPDSPANYVLLKRGRRHDRFSSALPFAQKGTGVALPLGTSAPVLRRPNAPAWLGFQANTQTPSTNGAATYSGGLVLNGVGASLDPAPGLAINSGLYTDLAQATSATLNQVRQSYAVQHLLEADARGGTRDVESIQHRWGVTVPDFRLQRPEYLGGSTFTFDGHLVPQSAASGTTGSTTPQANLAQFSQAMGGLRIAHSFVEHGVFMILFNARSNMTYQDGLDRELTYYTRFDWYQPEFANLGEVAMRNSEIYFQGNSADVDPFGYQEYAYELRYGLNRVSGEMRSNYTTSLDVKHMADDYASLPTLGPAWMQSNTPISRNIVVSAATADPIELNTLASGMIARTLPMYSIPGLKRL